VQLALPTGIPTAARAVRTGNRLINVSFQSRMPASADAVFRWHAEPGAFALLQPPWEKARIIERTGGIGQIGSRMTIRLSFGPFTKDWVAEHTACEPGRMFRDVMRSGPFRRSEHTHLFLPDPDDAQASWLEDRTAYQLPLGWLGKLFAGAWTRRKLARLFAYRHRVTAQAVASPAKISKDETNDVSGKTH
jgi:ligand-binding SRPBCC domain-containing protein